MSNFYCDFDNQTKETYTMAVYQELPSSVGLDSVSWKQSTAPQGGRTGVNWSLDFNVAIADYKQTGGLGVYKASQTLAADLGTKWQIVFKDGVQQLIRVGNADQANQIIIANRSNQLANPGIGMSGEGSVFKQAVPSGAGAQFVVTPTYFVGLFNKVELGEVISSNVIVGPLKIVFPSGMNAVTLKASMSGANINLDLSYSHRTLADAAFVKARSEELARARQLAAA